MLLRVSGIGVDDMFVIIQALEQLSPAEKALPVPERVAAALKHAGVSITVTSLTDILAFGVGATTVSRQSGALHGYACVFLTVVDKDLCVKQNLEKNVYWHNKGEKYFTYRAVLILNWHGRIDEGCFNIETAN